MSVKVQNSSCDVNIVEKEMRDLRKEKKKKKVTMQDDPKIHSEKSEVGRDADAEGEGSKQQLSGDGDLSWHFPMQPSNHLFKDPKSGSSAAQRRWWEKRATPLTFQANQLIDEPIARCLHWEGR